MSASLLMISARTPVSSHTSRSAVCRGFSPGSTVPFGNASTCGLLGCFAVLGVTFGRSVCGSIVAMCQRPRIMRSTTPPAENSRTIALERRLSSEVQSSQGNYLSCNSPESSAGKPVRITSGASLFAGYGFEVSKEARMWQVRVAHIRKIVRAVKAFTGELGRHEEGSAPQLPAISTTPQAPPKIGIALGGGFARGLAHIGVLRVLCEE